MANKTDYFSNRYKNYYDDSGVKDVDFGSMFDDANEVENIAKDPLGDYSDLLNELKESKARQNSGSNDVQVGGPGGYFVG